MFARSLCWCSAIFFSAFSFTKDIYVKSSSTAENPDGTQTSPFRRFTRAFQEAEPGDTIFVAPGDYPETGDFGLGQLNLSGVLIKHWGGAAQIGVRTNVTTGEWDDADNDGIPDQVEIKYGLNPNSAADAVKDKDRDGLTNLEEYERDTKLDVSNFTGGLTGQFAVDPSGSASYTIPISVPPGTAGMQPNLSIIINSRGGPGLVGVGGSLAGLCS
jgi:hypothetical protein